MPHDGDALADIVGAVAFDHRALRVVAVLHFLDDLELCVGVVGVTGARVVELRLHVGKAVDAADNLRRVFAETVQDNAELVLAHLVCVCRNLDGAFCRSKRFVARKECEALCLF